MSPVITETDVAILMSQKTADGKTLYLYPIVRDSDVMLSVDEEGIDNLQDLLEKGVKPSFSAIQAMFVANNDIEFVYDESTNTVKGKHKNAISSGTVKGSEGEISHGGEIRIPTISYDANGHITGTSTTVITLPTDYSLPAASTNVLGGVIVGTHLSVDESGKLSVKDASTSQKGVVKLNNSTDSTSTDEAATPKAVKDALALAIEAVNDAITELHASGVKPDFDSLSSMFASTSDIKPVVSSDGNTVGFSHANEVTAGSTVANTNKTVGFGGNFYVPEVTYDKNGHITGVTYKTITMPANPNTTYDMGVSSDENLITEGDVYDTVAEEYTIKFTGTDGTDKSATIRTAFLRYKEFSGNSAGLVPEASSDDAAKFLKGDGTWATPADTTYTGNKGIVIAGNLIGHENSLASAGTFNPGNTGEVGFGDTISVPKVSYDAHGHITGLSTVTFTLPENPVVTYTLTKSGNEIKLVGSDGSETTVTDSNDTYTLAKLGVTVSAGEINYLSGVKSNIQTQLDNKSDDNHTHNYAGSSSAGGAATKAIGDEDGNNIQATYIKSLSVSGKTITITKGDGTTSTITTQDTTYSDFTGASSSTAGVHGLVPAPASGKQGAFLRGDGTWATPTDTKYTHPSYTNHASGLYKITVDATGHVSAVSAVAKSDITDLGIPAQDTVYTHPTHTAKTSGLYKITVNSLGHVSATSAVAKSDITALGIPAQDTTYGDVTSDASGLMTPELLEKLNGIATGANKYTHPGYTSKTSGLYKITVDSTGHVSATAAVAKSDITALGIPAQDTTYSDFTGASSSAAGAHGLVPAPAKGKQGSFLRGDGTWATPTDTKYTHPTSGVTAGTYRSVTVDANGHVTGGTNPTTLAGYGITDASPSNHTHSSYVNQNAFGKVTVGSTTINSGAAIDTLTLAAGSNVTITADATNKKVTIAATDTKYTHPSYTAKSSGFYKVTVDATGHVSAVTAVTKSDITGLGIPGQDTVYTHPTYTSRSSGLYKITVNGTGHVSGASAVTASDIVKLGLDNADVVSSTEPSAPSSGYIMWYNVLSTEA